MTVLEGLRENVEDAAMCMEASVSFRNTQKKSDDSGTAVTGTCSGRLT